MKSEAEKNNGVQKEFLVLTIISFKADQNTMQKHNSMLWYYTYTILLSSLQFILIENTGGLRDSNLWEEILISPPTLNHCQNPLDFKMTKISSYIPNVSISLCIMKASTKAKEIWC